MKFRHVSDDMKWKLTFWEFTQGCLGLAMMCFFLGFFFAPAFFAIPVALIGPLFYVPLKLIYYTTMVIYELASRREEEHYNKSRKD